MNSDRPKRLQGLRDDDKRWDGDHFEAMVKRAGVVRCMADMVVG